MHKYIALIFAFSFIFLTQNVVFGQIHKGSWLIGGGGNYTTSKYNSDFFPNTVTEYEQRSTYFSTEIGYFITDRIVIGGKLGAYNLYSQGKSVDTITQSTIEQTSRNRSLQIAPFGRYYFTPTGKVKLYGQLMVGTNFFYNKSVAKLTGPSAGDLPERESNTFQLNINGALGADYFIAPNLAIEGSLSYQFYRYDYSKAASFDYTNEKVLPKFKFEPAFTMRFFLNTDKKTPKILAEQYLAQSNWTFGVSSYLRQGTPTLFNLTPSVGYFIKNRLLLQSVFSCGASDSDLSLGVSPTIKYFQPLSKSTQIVGKIGTYGSTTYRFDDKIIRYTKFGFINGGIGLNRFITDNLSVEGTFNFSYYNRLKEFNFNPNIQFGLAYFMDKKLGKKRA